MRVYIGLGTNLGDRRGHLMEALQQLRALGTVSAVASLWESEPVGYADQAAFLNTVIEFTTRLAPLDLLARLKTIERTMGRGESFRNAPRPIDLDIELYANDVVNDPYLTIPHPRLHQRRFILEPLAELAPQLRHPVLDRSIADLLASSDDAAWVIKIAERGWEADPAA